MRQTATTVRCSTAQRFSEPLTTSSSAAELGLNRKTGNKIPYVLLQV